MHPRDIFLALLIAAIWGLNFIAAKVALEAFTPMVANAFRFGIVAILLVPFLKTIKGQMKLILWVAFLLGVMHFGLVNLAVIMAGGVGAISIAAQLGVPFSTILAVIVLKETVGWKRVFGISLSFMGVVFLTFDPVIFNYWYALVVMSGAALMYAICSILMRKMPDVHPMTTQAWVGVVGCLGSVLMSFALETGQMEVFTRVSSEHIYALLFMSIGSSVIGHGSANYLFGKYEVSAVSPYFLIMPLFAIVGGVLWLDESVSMKVIIGGVLTIAGVFIVTLRNSTRHSAAADLVKTEG